MLLNKFVTTFLPDYSLHTLGGLKTETSNGWVSHVACDARQNSRTSYSCAINYLRLVYVHPRYNKIKGWAAALCFKKWLYHLCLKTWVYIHPEKLIAYIWTINIICIKCHKRVAVLLAALALITTVILFGRCYVLTWTSF